MLTRGYNYYIKLSKNMVLNPKDGRAWLLMKFSLMMTVKEKT